MLTYLLISFILLIILFIIILYFAHKIETTCKPLPSEKIMDYILANRIPDKEGLTEEFVEFIKNIDENVLYSTNNG